MHYLGKIASIINNSDDNFIYALGDFNAHINFGGELLSLCEDEGLVLSDLSFLGYDRKKEHTFTFVSEAHQSTSWLDHCASNSLGHNNIVDMEVLYNCVSSDHLPLMLCIKSTDIISNNVTLDSSSSRP